MELSDIAPEAANIHIGQLTCDELAHAPGIYVLVRPAGCGKFVGRDRVPDDEDPYGVRWKEAGC